MSDWSRPFDVAYRVMRVDRVSGVEVAELPWVISGGSIDRDLGEVLLRGGKLLLHLAGLLHHLLHVHVGHANLLVLGRVVRRFSCCAGASYHEAPPSGGAPWHL